MKRAISAIVTVLWGAWFGGLLCLFGVVIYLFDSMPHKEAGDIASGLFIQAAKAQLLLAGTTLVAIFVSYVVEKSRSTLVLFALIGLAAGASATSTAFILPQLESLRRNDQTHSAQFQRLHGQSMELYLAEEALLLIAGLVLPSGSAPKKIAKEPSNVLA